MIILEMKILAGAKHMLKQPILLSLCINIRSCSAFSVFPKSSIEVPNCESSLKNKIDNCHYYFEDGLRKVYPYSYHYKSYCKGRWINKKIIDAYYEEFALFTREECERRITEGVVKVNNKKTDLNYLLKNKDFISADVHKHELPVLACPIEILFEDDNFFVVDKPPSIPVHPCGLYMKNSLINILEKEYNKNNLFVIHRLDRLTSGVLVFTKSYEKSKQLHGEMNLRNINKEYICRVEGNFPDGTVICNKPISQFYHRIGVSLVDPMGKMAVTEFKKLSYNGKSSVVLCKPYTGRTHQIRVHLQFLGHPIVNDPVYNSYVFGDLKAKNGVIEKPIMQLLEDMLVEHSSEWCLEKTPKESNILNEKNFLNFAIFKEYHNIKDELLNCKKDCSKITYDKNCYFCNTPNQNPVQSSLGLFLHACKYEGKEWSFKSKMPFWASEDWDVA